MDHQEMGMYQTFVDKVPKNNPKRIKWRQIHGQLNEVCCFSTLLVFRRKDLCEAKHDVVCV